MTHHKIPPPLSHPNSPSSLRLAGKLAQLADLVSDLWVEARAGAVLSLIDLTRLDALTARLDRVYRMSEDNYADYHQREE